jgi:hypothetical protein
VLADVSPVDAAAIEAAAQAIETAVINLLFEPSGNNGPNGNGSGGGTPSNVPPFPAIPAPATTPGAGGP